jgi:hypothetical protein
MIHVSHFTPYPQCASIFDVLLGFRCRPLQKVTINFLLDFGLGGRIRPFFSGAQYFKAGNGRFCFTTCYFLVYFRATVQPIVVAPFVLFPDRTQEMR